MKLLFLFSYVIAVIAAPTQDSDADTFQMNHSGTTITDLPNELLNEMIFKMNPGDAERFMVSSKKIYDSMGKPQKQALLWLKKSGPLAFIPYMASLNKSFSELTSTEKQTADVLIKLYPTPEALVFSCFQK